MSTRAMIIINKNENNTRESINIIDKLVSNDTKDLQMYYKHNNGIPTYTLPAIFLNAGNLTYDISYLDKCFEKIENYHDDIEYLYILDANNDITVVKHYQEGMKGYKNFKFIKDIKYNDIKKFFDIEKK